MQQLLDTGKFGAIATGYGPDILTNLDGLRPLVREQDVVLFGYRDAELV